MHPEQGLWLSTPFPSWLKRVLFHWLSWIRESLLRFPQMAASQGVQTGKVIKFSILAGSTISPADWCAQCITQTQPLERFQEGRGTYFIHQSSDFWIGTIRVTAVDLPALSQWDCYGHLVLPAWARETICFPWQCPHPAQHHADRWKHFLGKTTRPDLQAPSDGDSLLSLGSLFQWWIMRRKGAI